MADRLSSEAVVSIKRAEENAASEIEAAKKEAAAQIEKITSERDHAFRERDDARMLAQEKTASNDLLLKQMTDMEADLSAYKTLQQQYKELLEKYNALQVQLKEKEMKAELDKERAVMAKEREMQDLLRQADRESAKLQAKIEQLSSVKTGKVKFGYEKEHSMEKSLDRFLIAQQNFYHDAYTERNPARNGAIGCPLLFLLLLWPVQKP